MAYEAEQIAGLQDELTVLRKERDRLLAAAETLERAAAARATADADAVAARAQLQVQGGQLLRLADGSVSSSLDASPASDRFARESAFREPRAPDGLRDGPAIGDGPVAESQLPGGIHALAFVGSGPLVVSGGNDGTLRAHETRGMAVEGSTTVVNKVLCIEAAPDPAAPRVASAGGTGNVISDAGINVWRVESGPADFAARVRELL